LSGSRTRKTRREAGSVSVARQADWLSLVDLLYECAGVFHDVLRSDVQSPNVLKAPPQNQANHSQQARYQP
jgi:hypothetical protein